MENKEGIVFSIQPFSIHDGKGIRTNVFLKGCPLRCRWCHNPEGLNRCVEIAYYENKCHHCGACGDVYKDLKNVQKESEEIKKKIVHSCPYRAYELLGKRMTVQEVIDEVMIDYNFYQTSQGGMTISGGEAMMQADFVCELLKEAKKKGLSTALETSGYAPKEAFQSLYTYVDQFLWDYKVTNPKSHKELTGVDSKLILDNFEWLYAQGAHMKLRCPLIPNVNDTEEHLKGIAHQIVCHPNLDGWEVMPYHDLGLSKEKRIGNERGYQFTVPSSNLKEEWNQKIKQYMEEEYEKISK